MPFYATIGYRFQLSDGIEPDGSMILASAMPMHQLERRKFSNYPHLESRLFDPQLYMSALSAAQTRDHCLKLASYPWFGVEGLQEFDSAEHNQKEWKEHAEQEIVAAWPGKAPTDDDEIKAAVKECVEFQERIGCWALILPSPLTIDPSSDYREEEAWLDASLEAARDVELPKFATVAVSDGCLMMEPDQNQLLEIIVDAVSAREGLDGVYLVVEQGHEANDTRSCGNVRTLSSILHLVHSFAQEAGMRVGVGFLGAFGLACRAAGAEWWSSHWYKSLYRLRLADKLAGGRAYPSYWSYRTTLDVNMDEDFDALVEAGMLSKIQEKTDAADGLLTAAESGKKVSNVPAWTWRQSNTAATIDHFMQSAVARELEIAEIAPGTAALDHVQEWLDLAVKDAQAVDTKLGPMRKTNTTHVAGWRDALVAYRKAHKV